MIMKPLVEFSISCVVPVPWSPPQVFVKPRKAGGQYKSALRNPDLEFWQLYVGHIAGHAMKGAGRELSLAPLAADLIFTRGTDRQDLWGKCWFHGVKWRDGKGDKEGAYVKTGENVPDADNLAKATLDGMEGVVFGNDVQVCSLRVERRYGPLDGCTVAISELDDSD
jgi:Holliday junction resolvase RusA-like endonuclease